MGRPAPKLGPFRAVIDGWLEADRAAPRKQRHTAKRIHQRLVDELGADVAETTVRQYVRGRKRAMGWAVREVFVPHVHTAGVEAEAKAWTVISSALSWAVEDDSWPLSTNGCLTMQRRRGYATGISSCRHRPGQASVAGQEARRSAVVGAVAACG